MKNIILTEQMELSLQKTALQQKSSRRQARRDLEGASRWWFAQMRRVVDRAADWKREKPARPAQGRLALG